MDNVAIIPCEHTLHLVGDLEHEPNAKSCVDMAFHFGVCWICNLPTNKSLTSDQFLIIALISAEDETRMQRIALSRHP